MSSIKGNLRQKTKRPKNRTVKPFLPDAAGITLSEPIERENIRYSAIFLNGHPLTRIINGRPIWLGPDFSQPLWTPKKSQAEHAEIHRKYNARRKAIISEATKRLGARFGSDPSRWPRSEGQKNRSVFVYYPDGEVRRIA